MALRLVHSNKFEANKWLISARWFYAPAIFVMGLLSKLDPFGEHVFPVPTMILLFSVFILVNVLFWYLVKQMEIKDQPRYLDWLGSGQIFSEFVFFTVILHLSGGVESVAPIFFFIPIVSSIILFNPLSSLLMALIAGLLVNGALLAEYYGWAQKIYGYAGRGIISYEELLLTLSSTIVITAVYFIVGSLTGYLSSAIRKREEQLRENRREAELQAEKLRLLNEEYSSFARKLVRQGLELKKESEEISRLNREKGEFVSAVAHQLRTPLSAIKWTLDLLLQKDNSNLSSDQRSLLMKAYESNERIINLIQDMLGASKAETGMIDLAPVEINFSDLIKSLLDDFKSSLAKKNIKTSVEIEKNLPKIPADPQKIRAVFQNLIDNAIKYSKPKGLIVISARRVGNELEIVIADRGIGIPKNEQGKVFRKFFRAQNAVKIDPDGSGLGLFIVKSLVEKHNGRIGFESVENQGSKFLVTLPLRRQK